MCHIVNEIGFNFRNLSLTYQLIQGTRISNNNNQCKNYRQYCYTN